MFRDGWRDKQAPIEDTVSISKIMTFISGFLFTTNIQKAGLKKKVGQNRDFFIQCILSIFKWNGLALGA